MRLGAAGGRWLSLFAASCAAASLVSGPAVPPSTGAALGASPPTGAEKISFESRNPNQKSPVPAVLLRPPGDGPFAAVVLVHPCGGVTPTMYQDWAPWFVARQYIVVAPDSLAPWHQTSVCFAGGPRPTAIHPDFRDAALDAWGALRFLRSRKDVIPNRVAIVGWSFGGSTVLVATSTRFADRLARGEYGGFDAGIAVYPGCGPFAANGPAAEGVKVPLLLLLGGADDWAPPDACVKGAAARRSAGDSIDVHVYPGVYHEFDVPTAGGTAKIGAATVHIGYNAAASADAHAQVGKFLDEHLK